MSNRLSENKIRLKLAQEMPFSACTDYQVFRECSNQIGNIFEIFNNNSFAKQIKTLVNNFTNENYNCKYYNTSEFQSLIKNLDSDSLKMIHFNIRSFEKNKFLLYSSLELLNIEFDIIFLSEIGKVNVALAESIFKGYKLIHQPPSTNKGGAGMLIKIDKFDSICEIKDPKYCITKTCECTNCLVESVRVKLSSDNKEFIASSIYRHPNGNIDHFVDSIEPIFSDKNDSSWHMVAGDMNINLLNADDEKSSNYVEKFLNANFIPCINLPTRFCDTTATLIDHIMLKVPRKLIQTKVTAGNLISDITDHLPNFALVNTKITKKIDRPYIRLFTKKKIQKFIADIPKFDPLLNENDNQLLSSNVHDSYNEFIKNLKIILDQYFPLVKLSRAKAKNKPFITPGIRVSIKHRDKLFHKYLNNKTPNNRKAWTRYRNKVTETIKAAEKLFYQRKLKENSDNCQSLWKVFGSILNNKKKSKSINKIKVNNRELSDQNKITDEFNKYFSTIGAKLAENFNSENTNHKAYLMNKVENSFFLHFTTEREIIREINNLDCKKSPGYDNISVKFIQAAKNLVAKPLMLIFNKAITSGQYPDALKIAKVIPLFKKGDNTLITNYRPISLLSLLNKIFEKLLYRRLYKFLHKHNVLYKYQFGFRKGYSTTMALIEILNNIKIAIDNNKFVCGIFLDLTKAFDTVDHQILLNKLHHYGVRGQTNNLFKSYLSNRKQFVKIGNSESSHQPINCGVPQGSVLGPLLFLIYVNDIANYSPLGNIRLFADDTNVFVEHENLEQLYENAELILKYLYQWFKDNKLTVNTKKSSFTIFTTSHIRNNTIFPDSIIVNNERILISNSTKYLGVTIDQDLSWKEHIQDLCNTLKGMFSVFYNIRSYLTIEHIKTIYYALIYSRIKYGLAVYGSANKIIINKVQVLQNQLLKVLTEKPYRYSTDKLHNELKLLKVEDLYKQEILTFVHNFQNNKLPPVFNSYFTSFSNIHNINTRYRNTNFIVPRVSSNLGSTSISFEGAIFWNNLDTITKEIKSVKLFRKSIKDTVLPYPET